MKRFLNVKKWVPLALVVVFAYLLYNNNTAQQRYTKAFYGMSTIIDQKVYGKQAEEAMDAVEQTLLRFEQTLSLYNDASDIARINASAGVAPVAVSADTINALLMAKELALQSENAFALTIAPITEAWGVTTDTPHILSQTEIDALLPLVDDTQIEIDVDAKTVFLPQVGQAIDLGGIAKGVACEVARDVYEAHGVDSAILSIGGNVYVKGTQPDGSLYRIGFRDPLQNEATAIASVAFADAVFAVSGGYERYFEQDGVRYHHIIDPATGSPAQSDIVSVGVLHPIGGIADFYSTTLFVQGKEKTLEYMENGGVVMMLDNENNFYISKVLENTFEMVEDENAYNIIFVG